MKKAIAHLRAGDPVLDRVIARVGACRIRYHEPDFRALARSIVFQQLNGTAAAAIFERFEAACGGLVTAETTLKLRMPKLKSVGLSERKAEYIRDLASHVRNGSVDFESFRSMPDDEIIATLTAVRGIGEWTVHMFLIFALRRQNVLPVGDYGVRAAMRNQYGLPDLPKPAEMRRIAEPWRPYASIASWYMWRSLEGPAEL